MTMILIMNISTDHKNNNNNNNNQLATKARGPSLVGLSDDASAALLGY